MLESGGRSGSIQKDINVTPLADVCLVLLIVFMLVTPYLLPGMPVQLPKATNPDVRPDEERGATITLQADGSCYLQSDLIPLDALLDRLSVKLGEGGDVPVYLRADRGLAFGEVKKVLATVERAGSRQVQLSVEHVDSTGRPVTGTLPASCPKEKRR